jgi:hypothetical protein
MSDFFSRESWIEKIQETNKKKFLNLQQDPPFFEI